MLTEAQQALVRSAIVYHSIYRDELAKAAKAGESDFAWKHFEQRRDFFLKQLGMETLYPEEEREF